MSNYANGRAAEYKTMRFFEKQGYECFRSAGSHGLFDVIAVGKHDMKLCQVKKDTNLSAADEEAIRLFKCPQSCQKLLVVWKFRQTLPIMREVG